MKLKKSPLLCLAALALAIPAAHAAVITDFSTFSDSGTFTASPNLLQQTWSTTTGVGVNTVRAQYGSGTGAAGQDVFLSDAFKLTTVGMTLIVDAPSTFHAGASGGSTGAAGVGLAIATTEATGRTNLVTWFWRKTTSTGTGLGTAGTLRYDSFGASSTTPISSQATDAYSTFSPASIPDSLFITKTSTGFDLGYIEGGVSTTLYNLVTGTTVTATGDAIGIYADTRGTSSNYIVNNLRIIPEPSTALLGGLGLLALLRRRR